MRTNMIDQETNMEISLEELCSLIIKNPKLMLSIFSPLKHIEDNYVNNGKNLLPTEKSIIKCKKKVWVSPNSVTILETAIDATIYRLIYLYLYNYINICQLTSYMSYLELVSDNLLNLIESSDNVDIKEHIDIYTDFYNFYHDFYLIEIYLKLSEPDVAKEEFKKHKAGIFDKDLKEIKKFISKATDDQIEALFDAQIKKQVKYIESFYKDKLPEENMRVVSSEHDKVVSNVSISKDDELAQELMLDFNVLIHLPAFVFTAYLNKYYGSYTRLIKLLDMEKIPGSSLIKSKEVEISNKRYIILWLADKYSTGFITINEAIDILLRFINGNHKKRTEMCNKRRHLDVNNRYLQKSKIVDNEIVEFKY